MKEETRKRIAFFLFVFGVAFAIVAIYSHYRWTIIERVLRLLKLRRTPGSWV